MQREILIIDVKHTTSVYRLMSYQYDRKRKSDIILIPVHCLKALSKLESMFPLSYIARLRKAYLYPSISRENLILARDVACSVKTKQTVHIAISMWIKGYKVTILTDLEEVRRAMEAQDLEGIEIKKI